MDLAAVQVELAASRLPAAWEVCSQAQGAALAAQLQRELRPGHALHERECVAVAKHGACDDVLYFVAGDESRAAKLTVVHLTWHVPRDAGSFPWAEEFGSVREWVGAATKSRGK